MHTTVRHLQFRRFSLIEILVVIAIIALMATVVIPNVIGIFEGQKVEKAKMDCKQLANGVTQFYLALNQYPEELDDLVSDPGLEGWKHAFVQNLPQDPWGRDYQIDVPGSDDRPFEVYSYGADGTSGGEGNNADIYDWSQ
jgi:general secretion pathway protein G